MTRGEIYRVRLPGRRGREQAGPRYAVIVQAEELLGLSPEIEIAGETTRVLVEQLRAVDVERLDDLAGRLTSPEQRTVDEALGLVLDLG